MTQEKCLKNFLNGNISTWILLEKHEFVDDMGALILALEIEGKAYSLYSKLAKSAVDTNAKVVFQEMSEQEPKHIEYLKK